MTKLREVEVILYPHCQVRKVWSLRMKQARALELDPGIDMSKYVGGAIVVFDLRLRRVKWQQHLDLSTDSTPYRAYIYSAPVLVDLDRDGKLEVVVGTSAVRNTLPTHM